MLIFQSPESKEVGQLTLTSIILTKPTLHPILYHARDF